MLTDDITITAHAGKGGDGLVAFAKTKMSLGPTGGSGGRGGNVIAHAVTDLGALRRYRNQKDFFGNDGKDGGQNNCEGANGEDAVLRVPVGTVIHDCETGEKQELTKPGQEIVLAKGGNGGFGNFHFRGARNTSPKQANTGKPGEKKEMRLELKLIADIGFVGYPNVGKSSLLNALTNASSRVANYKFTTLEPHLGVYYELILADIPGLIDGAAEGKGLGHKFLRHIERTRMLFHFVAADSSDPLGDYHAIRKELSAYSKKLGEKPEWIVVSRADEVTEERLKEIAEELSKENKNVITLSILDDDSLAQMKKHLNSIKKELTAAS